MNGLVLSGVPGIVLSGVSLSCYQACEIAGKLIVARVSACSNFPNSNTLTFNKSAPFRWKTARRHCGQLRKPGLHTRRAAP
ncbi:hypothetical protein ACS15_1905 [Ralstonia insidiosa]|uniref:Uncharacterized protein n=1 Tax=Ralstonia insidiosa TaxID=190721 RepID=A0AAC9BIY3_9RALS|nr:hypothetical protein ACS15_1905 [Ralstonia insidiosa]